MAIDDRNLRQSMLFPSARFWKPDHRSLMMSVVASEISPLNCRWITWNDSLPVCTRPSAPARRVNELECSICDFWTDGNEPLRHGVARAAPRPKPATARDDDPLNRESCPRCGSHDVVLMQSDALVQSFSCSICRQRWLASRPWPRMNETRSYRSKP